MTEILEPLVCDHNPVNGDSRVPASVRQFTAFFAAVAMILGLVFASVQPASADAPTASINWTAQTAAAALSWKSVTYGDGKFVAVNLAGDSRAMTSTDGISWSTRTSGSNTWTSVTYGGGTFVAVAGKYGGANQIMTSTNGADTWTTLTPPEYNWWSSVAYGTVSGTGLFVAVSTGGTKQVMHSSDGTTWTGRTAASGEWNSITYGDGKFVAVAGGGTNRVMTSTDGITWTAQTAAAANNWTSVTYGGGTFVAVSDSGDNRVMVSTDGITWTAQTAATTNSWNSVTYGGGKFVGVSSSGAKRVMTGISTVPAAPTSLVATPGSGSASIAFVAGADGGYAITKYQYQIGSGSWLDAPAGTTSPVVIAVSNYVTSSIKLRAYNSSGPGAESTAVSVTAKVTAPVIASAYSGNMSGVGARGIIVGFTGVTPPGATMVSYRINAYVKGTNTVVSTVLVRSRDRAGFLSGLTAGTEYDIRVIGYLTLTGSPLITRGTLESATRTAKV